MTASAAPAASHAELPGEHNAAAQVVLLQRDLAQAHTELAATQERLTELETLQVRQRML
jgi:hypothetical protein